MSPKRRLCGLWLAASTALLSGTPGAAQIDPGTTLTVYLVTVDPGKSIISRFGHTAIRIRDTASGADRAYGFAQSDLQRRGAFSALIQGQVEASSGDTDTAEMFERYAQEGRSVWIQELSLDPHERAALKQLLDDFRRRGAGSFQYDFFGANCTTKVRDVLDEVLDGQLRTQTAELPSGLTYRAHAARLSRSHLVLYALSNLLMADAVDQPITVWDGMFLPANLREGVRAASVVDGEGRTVPLVRHEELRPGSTLERRPATATSPWFPWLLGGTLLGIALVLLGSAATTSVGARIAFAFVGGGWALGVGLLGLVLVALWAFGDQTLVAMNENLLPVSPLSLLVAVSAWGSEKGIHRARVLAAAVAGLAALGLLLKVFPAFDQDSAPILALTIPVHLGLALGLWRFEPEGR